ncbi:hypothetical protein Scep_017146 [Stephania cephalantha]|uniref:Uncharacterized protein n=1 Tax=Stephania cephalantha TaxID=152367 RepID=A0AAP0INZ3_9MAGN
MFRSICWKKNPRPLELKHLPLQFLPLPLCPSFAISSSASLPVECLGVINDLLSSSC